MSVVDEKFSFSYLETLVPFSVGEDIFFVDLVSQLLNDRGWLCLFYYVSEDRENESIVWRLTAAKDNVRCEE